MHVKRTEICVLSRSSVFICGLIKLCCSYPCHQVGRMRWSSTRSSPSWTGTVCWGRRPSSSLTWSQRRTPATLTVRVSGFMCLWKCSAYINIGFMGHIIISWQRSSQKCTLYFEVTAHIYHPFTPSSAQPARIVITTSTRTTRMTPMTTSRWRSGSSPPAHLASARSDFFLSFLHPSLFPHYVILYDFT